MEEMMEYMGKFEHLLEIKPEESFELPAHEGAFYTFRLINDNIDRVMSSSNLNNIMEKILGMKFNYRHGLKYSLAKFILDNIEGIVGIVNGVPDVYHKKYYEGAKLILGLILQILKEKNMGEQAKSFILSLCDSVNRRVSKYGKEIFSEMRNGDSWSGRAGMSQYQRHYEGNKVSIRTILKALRDRNMAECEKLFIDKLDPKIKMEMKDVFPENEHQDIGTDKLHEGNNLLSTCVKKPNNNTDNTNNDIKRNAENRLNADKNKNEVSKEKQDFISRVAKEIKSKLEFEISGYGSKKSKNIFCCLFKNKKTKFSDYMCGELLAQRMKHEFGGCQITNAFELIQLISEINFCDWPDYFKKITSSQKTNDEKRWEMTKNMLSLRRFWQRFLFCETSEINSMPKIDINRQIKIGIFDESHPLKKDYQVVPDNIIKNVDELVGVVGSICSNKTYLYLEPDSLFQDIADRLTDSEVFKKITPKHLDALLAGYKEMLVDLSSLDEGGVFEVFLSEFEPYKLLKVIINILEQSDDTEVIQRIVQWFNSFDYGDNRFVYVAVRESIEKKLFDHLRTNKVQLKLDDVCHFLALYFKGLSVEKDKPDPDPEVITKLLEQVFACCSDDMSQNNSKLDLDLILDVEQPKTLYFRNDITFSTFLEFLNTNIDKVSFSSMFMKKMFSSELEITCEEVSLTKWIYINAYFYLNLNKEESEKTKKRLISLKATINFMLKNSLTKDTKKDGDNFVTSLASIINQSGNNQEIDKLVIDFVLAILRDNKMADREKLFIDALSSELRPEITSVSHEPETKNLNDELKPDSHDKIKEENSQKIDDITNPENSKIDVAKSNVRKEFKLDSIEANPKLSGDVNLNSVNSCDAEKQSKEKEDGFQKDVSSSGKKSSKVEVDENKSNLMEIVNDNLKLDNEIMITRNQNCSSNNDIKRNAGSNLALDRTKNINNNLNQPEQPQRISICESSMRGPNQNMNVSSVAVKTVIYAKHESKQNEENKNDSFSFEPNKKDYSKMSYIDLCETLEQAYINSDMATIKELIECGNLFSAVRRSRRFCYYAWMIPSEKYETVKHNFTKWERFKIYIYCIVWFFVKPSKKNVKITSDVPNKNESVVGNAEWTIEQNYPKSKMREDIGREAN